MKKIHTTARRYDIINTNSDCDITINFKDDPTNSNLITHTEVLAIPPCAFHLRLQILF